MSEKTASVHVEKMSGGLVIAPGSIASGAGGSIHIGVQNAGNVRNQIVSDVSMNVASAARGSAWRRDLSLGVIGSLIASLIISGAFSLFGHTQ